MGALTSVLLDVLTSWVEQEARREASRMGLRVVLLLLAIGLLLAGSGLLLYALYLAFRLAMQALPAVLLTGAVALAAGGIAAYKAKDL